MYLAKLFLVTHDPTIPRIGPRIKSAMAEMQVCDLALETHGYMTYRCRKETSLSYVRAMCGIAVCTKHVPARFTASLAILICK